MKKILVTNGQTFVQFVVTNKVYELMRTDERRTWKFYLTDAQVRKHVKEFPHGEAKKTFIDFPNTIQMPWTMQEILDDINENGGFQNLDDWNDSELARWIETNYCPCSSETARKVVCRLTGKFAKRTR